MSTKLSDKLQKCKSIDDIVDAFVDVGFNRAHEINSYRKALSITPSGKDFLNIVVVDKMPSVLQPPEKRAGVRAVLYVSEDFNSYKFFDTLLISSKEQSYSFTSSILKSSTQLGILARQKINSLKFNEPDLLHKIVELSLEQAIKNFEENLSVVINSLRQEIIDRLKKNDKLQNTVYDTAHIFSSFIGPEFGYDALIELLIQHLLTKDIFVAAYGKTFHQSNVVANSLDILARCFDDIPTLIHNKHDLSERRDAIVQVIKLNPIKRRAEIIKLVYEAFYSVYNPKDADRLGIVYTPDIAVDFIIRSTDILMHKHLNTNFSHKNTHVLDPCIGTGTFMISLLNYLQHKSHINKKDLIFKYKNELHANEISILAYYIAAMNVERTIESLTGVSESFSGIVWRDTLLNINLDDFPVLENDNVVRMKLQNKHNITAILGNPPYNIGQKNFSDENPNPEYFSNGGVDTRISQTYHKKSKSRKMTLDMYKRFVRWSSDRIGKHGIIGFISNNSFVHANNYDGMRNSLEEEFDFIYICDLRGNANTRGEKRQKECGGFFGNKSKVGTALYFLIKTGKRSNKRAKIYYADVGDYKTQEEKFEWIRNKTIDNLTFSEITPDQDHNWVAQSKDPNYKKLIPLISFETKEKQHDKAIFQLFTNGVKTNADSWQIDFYPKTLLEKLKVYSDEYNKIRKLYNSQTSSQIDIMSFISQSSIPWYRELIKKAKRNTPMNIRTEQICPILYRPYISKYFCYNKICAQVLYRWPDIIPEKQTSIAIPSLCVRSHSSLPFECLAGYGFFDHTALLSSQNVPLYKLDTNGELKSNITQYGYALFRSHYQDPNITDKDIFYYCYAVLSDPIYVNKYEHEIQRLHPHIPLHPSFFDWCSVGKSLFELHANFKHQPKHPLHEIKEDGDASNYILNLTQSSSHTWKARIDGSLSLDGIPAEAADPKSGGYVIGSRTPIEWVLEYYQKACKSTILNKVPQKLARLDFTTHRTEIIDLVYRLCTVSLETTRLQKELSKLPHSFSPCKASCCKSLSYSPSPVLTPHLSKIKHITQKMEPKKL